MNKVYVLGGAQTDFERNWSREGKNVVAMLREVVSDGCENANITYDDIISLNEENRVSCFVGSFLSELYNDQSHVGALMTEVDPAFFGVPSVRVEAACAAGAAAIDAAVTKIVAFMNPENTFTVSKFQTGCGIVDIMMHTMERYFLGTPDCDLTERLAEGLLIAVRDAGRRAIADPNDYEARATLMWASSLSHNDLTGCGKPRYFPVHKLEHPVSALHDRVSHGAGLSVLFPAWAKFILERDIDVMKFAQLANRVWGVEMNYDHPERTAAQGIETMKTYFREIGMPVTLAELGLKPEDYEAIINLTTKNGTATVKSYLPLGKEEIRAIYKLAE